MSQIAVGIIGCGYWGPNLIRNFSACPRTRLAAVYDASPEKLEALRRQHPHLNLVSSLDEFLDLPLEAVAIATPVSTHFSLAARCLEAGRHVLVEKPLASTAAEAQALIDLAKLHQRVLMVDHTYLFSNAIRRVKELVTQGELGDLYYIDSVRINLGLFQHDINVVWDLAPHDLSIADHIFGYPVAGVSAWGSAHTASGLEDIAYLNLDFGNRRMANFHVNWLSPVKVRQMIFAGSRKSLIFNELNTTEPIKVYDRGIELGQTLEEQNRVRVRYRTGDCWSPHVEPAEALQGVVAHFAECIRDDKVPLSDGAMGLRVVQVLEAATHSLRSQGERIVFATEKSSNGTHRPGQLPPHRARRAPGQECEDPFLRQPVRLPDRG